MTVQDFKALMEETREMVGGLKGEAGDAVNQPPHYTAHPSGVEAIEITEHMNFCLGNAIKYIWRAGLKGDAVEDLRKARYYLDREIERIVREKELACAENAHNSAHTAEHDAPLQLPAHLRS